MLLIAFLLYVAAEITAFVLVAGQIGLLSALGILIVVSALGPLVVRRVGFGVLAHTRDRLQMGEVPTRELLDGLVVLIGGVFICVPGFIGDALGLLLMLGPIRHFVIRASGHGLARRVQNFRSGPRFVIDARSRQTRHDADPPGRYSDALGQGTPQATSPDPDDFT